MPGVIKYKGAKIQLLDLPGIIEGAKDGKGRGKQVIAGKLALETDIRYISYFRYCSHKVMIFCYKTFDLCRADNVFDWLKHFICCYLPC